MPNLSFPIAFSAGLVSFFAPCVFSLLPAYVGYVTGISISNLKKARPQYIRRIFFSSLFYILGFSIIFVIYGTAAATIGISLRRYDLLIQKIGGLIILIFGLEFAGFLNIAFLAKERRFELPPYAYKLGYLRAFLIGVIFAATWTPCVGAVLGSILALAAVSKTVLEGAGLLFVYSLGISIPFLIVSMSFASLAKHPSFIGRHMGVITKTAGLVLALFGILLLTDTYKYLNSWLFEIAFKLGYRIR